MPIDTPTLHGHLGCVCPRVRNVEYFHDHARIEPMLFEGARVPDRGSIAPDLQQAGLGLSLKEAGRAMNVSYKTADKHKASLMRKLDIHDRVELARFAIREKIIMP